MTITRMLRKTTLVTPADDRLAVHTLTFAIPNHSSSSKGKPHSEIRMDLGDVVKMKIPGYKAKSYSVSGLRVGGSDHDCDEFDITVKVYPNGRASGYLDRLEVGDTIESFVKSSGRERNPGSFVGIVAFGVGITEGLPVAQAELQKGTVDKVVLLWASRTVADTFWHEEMQALQHQYPDRFQVVHILSREEREGCLHGHINAHVLDQVFQPDDRSQARFLVVGTKEMMRMTKHLWEEIGYDMSDHALLPKARSRSNKHHHHHDHHEKHRHHRHGRKHSREHRRHHRHHSKDCKKHRKHSCKH